MTLLLLDYLLVALAVFTVALIGWKIYDLYFAGSSTGRKGSYPATLNLLDEWLERLEKGMTTLSSIAATAPFIGLAATVVHIRTAMTLIGGATADTQVIAGPIATALGSTLLGLASAIPATLAYNAFVRRLQMLENKARRKLNLGSAITKASA